MSLLVATDVMYFPILTSVVKFDKKALNIDQLLNSDAFIVEPLS